MEIQGIQKTTLLDYPGKVACTIFTKGCNFKCPFCHNASLVTHVEEKAAMSEEEFFSFLNRRKGILDGVCISGGEPMLQADLEDFIRKIRELGFLVKLDTNGTDPERLQKMIEEGLLDYVAMDIKNSRENYGKTAGTIQQTLLTNVQKSVELLMRGRVSYEFRTTVTKELHALEDFKRIASWIKGAEHYYLQAFVDSGDLIDESIHGVSESEMKAILDIVKEQIPNAQLRGVEN